MDFFDRHKALIITILIFLVLLLSMYNINISNKNQKVRETLIQLNNERTELPKQEEQKPEEKPAPPPQRRPNLETHQAFNQNQEETSKNLSSRLDEIFQKNAARQEAAEEQASDLSSGEFNFAKNQRQERQKASEGNNQSEKSSTRRGTMRNSSIAFSLVGRTAVSIPNPIYTCDSPGKVVVNIEVDATGKVVRTSINGNASSTSNECLTEQALQYAAQAKFSQLAGRNSQPGTITYFFQN